VAEYYPYEERPDGDWVLSFHPEPFKTSGHLSVRLFPSYDKAENYYGVKGAKRCYLSASDFAKKFGGESMLTWFRHLNGAEAATSSVRAESKCEPLDDLPDDSIYNRGLVALRLWEVCQAVGDRVRGANTNYELDEQLFVVRIDRLATEEGQVLVQSYTKQKRIICEGLLALNKAKCEELELQAMMRLLVTSDKLKTKQDPWRIFRYYAPELGDDGFLYYPTKRHKREDHEQNI
jgi:hypothetical protein